MQLKLSKKKTKSTINLPEVVDAYVVSDLKDALSEALSHGKPLDITADKVSSVDTTCCQALMVGQLAFQKEDIGFTVKKSSAPMLRALNRLGLNQLVTGDRPTSD